MQIDKKYTQVYTYINSTDINMLEHFPQQPTNNSWTSKYLKKIYKSATVPLLFSPLGATTGDFYVTFNRSASDPVSSSSLNKETQSLPAESQKQLFYNPESSSLIS